MKIVDSHSKIVKMYVIVAVQLYLYMIIQFMGKNNIAIRILTSSNLPNSFNITDFNTAI